MTPGTYFTVKMSLKRPSNNKCLFIPHAFAFSSFQYPKDKEYSILITEVHYTVKSTLNVQLEVCTKCTIYKVATQL
jgi:hypothetical protein